MLRSVIFFSSSLFLLVVSSGNGEVLKQLLFLSVLCQLYQKCLNLKYVILANRKSVVIVLCSLPQKENRKLSHPFIVCMSNSFCKLENERQLRGA